MLYLIDYTNGRNSELIQAPNLRGALGYISMHQRSNVKNVWAVYLNESTVGVVPYKTLHVNEDPLYSTACILLDSSLIEHILREL